MEMASLHGAVSILFIKCTTSLADWDTADPNLTEIGTGQAAMAHALWKAELADGLPLPEKLYCSPMSRALQTHSITFVGIIVDENCKTVVLEVWIIYHSYWYLWCSYPELPRAIRQVYMRQAEESEFYTVKIPSFPDRMFVCRRRPTVDNWARASGTRHFSRKGRFRQNIWGGHGTMYVPFYRITYSLVI